MLRSGFMALGLTAILMAMPAHADVKAGVDAWSRGDYATAIKEWRQPAINGDPDAQFNMGQAYKLGRGVPADLKIAEDWYRKAALQGHVQAEDNYGLVLFQNGDRQKALPFIEKSANRGEPRAQYLLGTALFNGDMVKKDWPRAYALMTRASAAGLPPASASLAQMDRYIPLDQRQKGIVIARELEAQAARPAILAETASRPPAKPAPVIKKAEVPPSKPAPIVSKPLAEAPKPEKKIAAVTPQIKPAAPKPAAAKPTAPKPAAPKETPKVEKPAPVQAAPVASGKAWRVQLGAFSEAGKAKALWGTLQGKIAGLSGLQSYVVPAGAVHRLQAGPLASRAAADKICASAKAAGQACLPVAP